MLGRNNATAIITKTILSRIHPIPSHLRHLLLLDTVLVLQKLDIPVLQHVDYVVDGEVSVPYSLHEVVSMLTEEWVVHLLQVE